MKKIISLKAKGYHIYFLDGKLYFLREELGYHPKFRSKKYLESKKGKLEEKAIHIINCSEIPYNWFTSLKHITSQYLPIAILCICFYGLSNSKGNDAFWGKIILKTSFKDYKHNAQNFEFSAKYSLNNIQKYIEKYNPTTEEIDLLVDNILLSDFESREEGFLFYAKDCIDQNNNFTEEEKEFLKKEIEVQIRTYGDLYKGHTILNALIEYANVSVMRDYDYITSTFAPIDKYGVIGYSAQVNRKKSLHRALSSSESMGQSGFLIYEDARAGFLSNDGYSYSKNFMTILGVLGDDEVIFKALINNDYNTIKENVLSKFSGKDLEEMQTIFRNIELISDSSQLRDYLYDEELMNQLNALYTARFGMDPQQNVLMSILENNISQEDLKHCLFSISPITHNGLTLTFERSGGQITIFPTGNYSCEDLRNDRLKFAIKYLKENCVDYEDALIQLNRTESEENLQIIKILSSENPYQELEQINMKRKEQNLSPLSANDIEFYIITICINYNIQIDGAKDATQALLARKQELFES